MMRLIMLAQAALKSEHVRCDWIGAWAMRVFLRRRFRRRGRGKELRERATFAFFISHAPSPNT